MKIKECIDIVDNLKPNQYSLEDKVIWLSFLDQKIINDVLLTHEGYHGEYDNFTGYSADRTNEELIVPSPYDRLYIAYINMKIDETNGETARYNNSATMFNTYYMEYKKFYHKTHMPLSVTERRRFPGKPCQLDVSEAQLEQLKKLLYAELNDDLGKMLSDDKIYDIIMNHVYTHTSEFVGPKGDKGDKGDDGTGVTILGSYETFAQLNENHPKGSEGDSYLVDGDLCVWSVIKSEWVNVGRIEGPQGERGPQGPQGIQGERGSDATVTKENIQSALGYTPANEEHAHSQYLEEEDISGKADVTYVEQLSNPNLLINSDFRNPINSMGKTSYTGGGITLYTIDKWRITTGTVKINSDSITYSNDTTSNAGFTQDIVKPMDISNWFTVSVKVKSISGSAKIRARIGETNYEKDLVEGINTYSNKSATAKLNYVMILLGANSSIELEWAKLEQGNIATPFVPRQHSEELLLCNDGIIGSNPNLLINGDFRNPINQRGKTSYKCGTSKTYTIDRWFGWELNVTLNDGYITLSTDKDNSFKQILENTLPQDDYTLSVKVKSVSGYVTFIYFTDEPVHHELSVGLNVFTFNQSVEGIQIYLRENSSVELEWIKLERGSVATPFVPRLYGEELALCWRYYFKLTPPRLRPTAYAGKCIYFRAYFPRMRVIPTASFTASSTIALYDTDTWAKISDKATSQIAFEVDLDFVDLKVASENYKDCTLNISNGSIILDAEIYS